MHSDDPAGYQFGEFILDIESWRLIKTDGEEIELTRIPFSLLKYLLEKKGKPVHKDQIIGAIWEGKQKGGEGSLNQLIGTLRSALNDSVEKKIIKTKPGFGYSFGIEANALSKSELDALLDRIKPRPDPDIIHADVVTQLSFQEWLGNSRVKWLFRFIVIVTILSSIYSLDNKTAIFIGSTSNILLVITALAYYRKYSLNRLKVFRPLSKDIANDSLKPEVKEATRCQEKLYWETTRDNAKDGSGIFRVCWQILLIIWVFLYGLLAVKLAAHIKDNYLLDLFTTFFNNLNTLLLAVCFYTFNTLEKGIKELRESGFWIIGFVLIVGLALAELLALSQHGLIDSILRPILTDQAVSAEDEISWAFRVISGVGGAIALALFVGRLQSKFFNPATKFTVIFYSYIAIQPLFVFFDDKSIKMQFVTAVVIHIALALKYFLFLYLFWAFESGRLLFYLVRVRQTNKEVEEEWQKFQIVLEQNTQ